MSLQALRAVEMLTGSNELEGGAGIDDTGAVALDGPVAILDSLVNAPVGRRREG